MPNDVKAACAEMLQQHQDYMDGLVSKMLWYGSCPSLDVEFCEFAANQPICPECGETTIYPVATRMARPDPTEWSRVEVLFLCECKYFRNTTVRMAISKNHASTYFEWDDPRLCRRMADACNLLHRVALRDHQTLSKCESPVEILLCQYLLNDFVVPQHRVGPYRIDLAFPHERLAIEIDGHAYHSSKEQRGRDAKRDRYLQENGWRVLRFTGSEVHADPGACAREVRKHLAPGFVPTAELLRDSAHA